MRLKTIWTLPTMKFSERIRRTIDWSALKIAARMPRRVRQWALILSINEVAQSPEFGRRSYGSITVDEIMDNQRMI